MHVRPIDPATATIPVLIKMEDPEGLTGKHEHPAELTVMASPGLSVLEVAMQHGVNIEHACGGVCACSTCHVYLERGEDRISPSTDAEEDRVEEAPGLQRNSRLSCQCLILSKPGAAGNTGPITVRVPAWNRNAVKEVPH